MVTIRPTITRLPDEGAVAPAVGTGEPLVDEDGDVWELVLPKAQPVTKANTTRAARSEAGRDGTLAAPRVDT